MNCTAIGKNKQACKNKAHYGPYCYWHQEKKKSAEIVKKPEKLDKTIMVEKDSDRTDKADKTDKTDRTENADKILEKKNEELTNEIIALKNNYNKLKNIYSNLSYNYTKLEYYVNVAKYSCPICLDESVSPSDIIIGYCTHTICRKCHDNPNNKTSDKCSLCREPFYQIEINS